MPAASESRSLYLSPSDSVPEDAVSCAEARLRMDETSFRLFYGRSAPKLLGYLLRVAGERSLAEDILQEAYCRFLQSKHPDMDEASQQSYLFRIATNLLRDGWRRRRESAMPESIHEPSTVPLHLDRQLELRKAFQHLKQRERQLLWLAYVEGSNHKEIAGITGLKPGSIRLLLFRARRKLASLIRTGAASRTGSSK